MNTTISRLAVLLPLISALALPAVAELPDPDGKPADMSKPVQVYILMGQSNMLEMGKVKGGDGSLEHAVKEKKLYPYLVDDAGNWTERKDTRSSRATSPRSTPTRCPGEAAPAATTAATRRPT
jgi:hypothetical protein